MTDKHSHYTKDKTINTMLKKLEYAIKTATKRIEEMKENMMSNKDDDIEAKIPDSSRRIDFKEIPLQYRIMENIIPDFKNLNSHPPGTKASLTYTRAGEARDTSQEKDTTEKDHSFLFADARFGGSDDTHNSDSNKQQKDGNKKQR